MFQLGLIFMGFRFMHVFSVLFLKAFNKGGDLYRGTQKPHNKPKQQK